MSRSAGPFTGRPPTIGLTPTTRSRRADEHVADARAPRGSDRSRSRGCSGRRGSSRPSRARRARRARAGRASAPSKRTATTGRLGAAAHEPLLHRELVVGAPARSRTVIRVATRSSVIGSSRVAEAPGRGDLGRDLGQRRAAAQALRCGRGGWRGRGRRGGTRSGRRSGRARRSSANVSPARPQPGLGVVGVGERVRDAVEVGADPQPVELVVVAGVDDDGDRRRGRRRRRARGGTGRPRLRRRAPSAWRGA